MFYETCVWQFVNIFLPFLYEIAKSVFRGWCRREGERGRLCNRCLRCESGITLNAGCVIDAALRYSLLAYVNDARWVGRYKLNAALAETISRLTVFLAGFSDIEQAPNCWLDKKRQFRQEGRLKTGRKRERINKDYLPRNRVIITIGTNRKQLERNSKQPTSTVHSLIRTWCFFANNCPVEALVTKLLIM